MPAWSFSPGTTTFSAFADVASVVRRWREARGQSPGASGFPARFLPLCCPIAWWSRQVPARKRFRQIPIGRVFLNEVTGRLLYSPVTFVKPSLAGLTFTFDITPYLLYGFFILLRNGAQQD